MSKRQFLRQERKVWGYKIKKREKNQRPKVFKRGDGKETHEDKARYKEIPSPEREA